MPRLNAHDTFKFLGTSGDVPIQLGTLGTRFDLDADGDSSIRASEDDVVEIEIGGTDTIKFLDGGLQAVAQSLTPNSGSETASVIKDGAIHCDVGAVTNAATDFIVLPSLASVPVGHTITIACNAGGNFEMRTPATSGEKINNNDSDGTKEYLCTDTDTVVVRKISDTDGWTAQSFQISGAVRTVVTPD